MVKFGDLFEKDGHILRVTAVSTDEVPTYTTETLHRKVETLQKVVTTSQTQSFLIPFGTAVTGVAESALGNPVGLGTAIASAVADGNVRLVFVTGDGSAVGSHDILKGAKTTAPVEPTLEGHTFDGWYSEADGAGTKFNLSSKTFNADTYLYANWVVVPEEE